MSNCIYEIPAYIFLHNRFSERHNINSSIYCHCLSNYCPLLKLWISVISVTEIEFKYNIMILLLF